MLFQQAIHKVYALKDVKFHMKTSEPEPHFHKVAGLQPAVLLKERLRLRCVPENFHKFKKKLFSKNTFRRLLSQVLLLVYSGLLWLVSEELLDNEGQ